MWLLSRWIKPYPQGSADMIDCSEDLLAYHDDRVVLSRAAEKKLRERRNSNRDRVRNGFADRELTVPKTFVPQGSYAMGTLVQRADDDYDIDDGVVVPGTALVGPRGAEKSGVEVRNLVRDCVHSDRFKTPPEVKPKCVRVYYNEGHHVDIPVYRERTDENGETYLEIGAAEWERSNPRGVTAWFEAAVVEKSPDDDNGRQMRRVVRYLKSWASSRASWNLASGFILSVLVDEKYVGYADRDDLALYECMRLIHQRLEDSLVVAHPVLSGTNITGSDADPKMVALRDKLADALKKLKVLTDSDCSRKAALDAWDDVFGSDYFHERLESTTSWTDSGSAPAHSVDKQGAGRYG